METYLVSYVHTKVLLSSRPRSSTTQCSNDAQSSRIFKRHVRRLGAGARPLQWDAVGLPFAVGRFDI
jgi:hypothetical protein